MSIYRKLFILDRVTYIRCKNHQEVIELFDIIAWFGQNNFCGQPITIKNPLPTFHTFNIDSPIYKIPNTKLTGGQSWENTFSRRIFVQDEKTAVTEYNNILNFDSLVIDSITTNLTQLENKLKI